MADLKTLLTKAGLQNVVTYIQSGNIVLDSTQSKQEVEEIVSHAIQNQFGYEVPSFAYTEEDWRIVLNECPYQVMHGYLSVSSLSPTETSRCRTFILHRCQRNKRESSSGFQFFASG